MSTQEEARARHACLRELWLAGQPITVIRDRMGFTSDNAVTAMATYLSLPPRHRGCNQQQQEVSQRVRELDDAGRSIAEIAGIMGRSEAWVRRLLRPQAPPGARSYVRGNIAKTALPQREPWPNLPPRGCCSYALVSDWKTGEPDPWCSQPTLPGRAYCITHDALCHASLKAYGTRNPVPFPRRYDDERRVSRLAAAVGPVAD